MFLRENRQGPTSDGEDVRSLQREYVRRTGDVSLLTMNLRLWEVRGCRRKPPTLEAVSGACEPGRNGRGVALGVAFGSAAPHDNAIT